ncbi:MAG: SAM-dependent methyltransferase, partial [Pollutimonas bauzanensis]
EFLTAQGSGAVGTALAWSIAEPDGALIVKAFHGSGFSQIVESFKQRFQRVVERKPKASRVKSSETFLVGRRLKP